MPNKLAFVFPGQGAQTVGMLADLAEQYPVIIDYYAKASDILHYDLWQITQAGPAEKLNQTVYTQPALLVAGYALYQIFTQQHDLQPHLLAGHSLGEYTALLAAGVFTFQEAVKLVAARAEYMQAACEPGVGAMAAIVLLSDMQVATLCEQVAEQMQQIVAPANYNSIGQVVIAGHKQAVEKVMLLAKQNGAKLTTLLPVSVPSHCHLMQPAADQLAQDLSAMKLQLPKLPIIKNVDARPYAASDDIASQLAMQLMMPVQWVNTILYFQQQDIDHIIECGPGRMLTGLNKRIVNTMRLQTATEVL